MNNIEFLVGDIVSLRKTSKYFGKPNQIFTTGKIIEIERYGWITVEFMDRYYGASVNSYRKEDLYLARRMDLLDAILDK